ncbi:MAG: NifB/NifX family molybdenum-iron cluster-binding protein, partial [Candidatus Izemoplasmataceae bacterium]
GDFVSKHFGRAKSYVLVTLQNNHITNKEVINLDESHCNHQETLLSLALNAIISGGMGEKPYERFMENGIKVLYAEGNIDDVIKEYSLGKLSNLSPHSHNH